MNAVPDPTIGEVLETVYQAESRRVLATLIRLLGDFDLAEDALQDAFRAALEQWPRDGVPANPRPWLVSAGRFKAIDKLRRRRRFDALVDELGERLEHDTGRRGTKTARSRMTGCASSSPAAAPGPVRRGQSSGANASARSSAREKPRSCRSWGRSSSTPPSGGSGLSKVPQPPGL